MMRFICRVSAVAALALAILADSAISAQDKYLLQVPNGIAFSDFRGYEGWQVVSVAQTDELPKVIVANPTMIEAYKAGVPSNGKPFPDGSKIARIQWMPKKSTEAPFVDATSDAFRPDGNGANCGYACFTHVKVKDYVYHPYQTR